MRKALETVNQFLELTSPKGRNIQELLPKIAELLESDFVFTGPLMTVEGREKYIALLSQFLTVHSGFRVLRQFEDGSDVCSINELTVTAPSGSKIKMEMAEWFKIRDGRIAQHTIFYDPREFSKAFGV